MSNLGKYLEGKVLLVALTSTPEFRISEYICSKLNVKGNSFYFFSSVLRQNKL